MVRSGAVWTAAKRKLRNAATLGASWARHLATSPARREAARDFARWLGTSLALDDGAREEPWFTFDALRWLDAHVTVNDSVFEWGSGGSTLYFARRARRVVSVEYDPTWYSRVAREVRARNLANVELLFVPPEARAAGGDAGAFASTGTQFEGLSFERYARVIERYPEASFDLVVVDGRARTDCLALGLPRTRPGGFVLVDNSEREPTAAALEALTARGVEVTHFAGPAPYNFFPGFWRTSVVRAPSPGR